MKLDPDFKFETSEEAIHRIYSNPWDTLHNTGNIIHQVESIERDAVDLYVALPRTECPDN